MNDRERFGATMRYQARDRSPIYDFSFWDETIDRWHEQGLPDAVRRENAAEWFGMDASIASGGPDPMLTGVDAGLCPMFEAKLLEDRGDHEVVQQADGVHVLRRKTMSSIPAHHAHLLVDRASWRTHYLPRLDPAHPGRFPADWERRVAAWSDPRREHIMILPGGSLFGRLRNWMGLEATAYVVHDDPAWFEEMVVVQADCVCGVLERLLGTGAPFEACAMWEDMCYSSGPLLSPAHFKRYLVPQYRRITGLLHDHGVDVVWVDCDGRIDELIPHWLDAGVNCMMPVEVGTWGADPVAYRRRFGRDLLMMGGFDKHVLARSRRDIEREVERLTPLVEAGGYVGFCDHRVPPDVSMDKYLFYLDAARARWGRNADLRPMRVRPASGDATP